MYPCLKKMMKRYGFVIYTLIVDYTLQEIRIILMG